MKRRFALLVTATVLPLAVRAQAPDGDDEIVVTASRAEKPRFETSPCATSC